VKLKLWIPLVCLAVFMMFAGSVFAQDADDATPISPELQNKVNSMLAAARASAPARAAEIAKNGAKSQQEARTKPVGDATEVCDVTFTSGTGENATQWCVTVNGNIPQFSVDGEEMINFGQVLEGYGICDATEGAVSYYDWAEYDSGNWAAPTFTHSGNTVTVTRLTSDGLWSLKQTIINTPATATGPGAAKITMALKNLSGISKNAFLVRYADVDADSDVTNDIDFTSQTSLGLLPGFNRGLASTNDTFNSAILQLAFDQDTYAPPDPCSAFTNLATQPFNGDGSIGQFWSFTLAKNATKTVVSTYKPI
jgi:hypothetical protein